MDSTNEVTGWPAFWYRAQKPKGVFHPPFHGNRKHGEYTKSGRAAIGQIRIIRAVLDGRFPSAFRLFPLPPVGWRHYAQGEEFRMQFAKEFGKI